MSDNKDITGQPDRVRVAGGERYEIEHLAQKHGVTPEEVRDAIARVGNAREALERELQKPRRH
ncbi:MAG TPA: DUF3606 domain-containing protein [Devosia sp.]|nr:DUF3606 domain-containing protein [Devosia sp.]